MDTTEVELLRTAMPCGHLTDYLPATRFHMVCDRCDRQWVADRRKGAVEVLEVDG